MKSAFLAAVVLSVGSMMVVGCKSGKEEGVKTNYRTQWTTVAAGTETTTGAAVEVLNADGLKDVKSTVTKLDGTASGKKADGTNVKVVVKRVNDASSEVSVTVGVMGDPTLGADIAKRIQVKAEGGAVKTTP